MSVHENLTACAGSWKGTNRLQDPNTNAPDESPSTATVTSILGDTFVRLDYTWAHQGQPQEGSLLIGGEGTSVTAYWIDTWHMGHKVMACQGVAESDGRISVRGSYAAPPGPDWGWRINLIPNRGQMLGVIMFNISPEGREELAVEAAYSRQPQ
jgi:hypothetical protein